MSLSMTWAQPAKGRKLKELKQFLQQQGLSYDDAVEYTVCLVDDDGQIAGTGSVVGNVLKCIAIDTKYRGEDLLGQIMTGLLNYTMSQRRYHLFLYTKRENTDMFKGMGFYPIAMTVDVSFMENEKHGVSDFIKAMQLKTQERFPQWTQGINGGVVVHCNPFTLGHQYLIEAGARACDYLHVFVLSQETSEFLPKDRLAMVVEGTAHLDNVIVHETGPYMISAATFPDYFLKDKSQKENISGQVDIDLFTRQFVPALHITRRFVGTEPYCLGTRAYNQQLSELLPKQGVEVVEIPRKTIEDQVISASLVRECIARKDLAGLRAMTPESTCAYLEKHGYLD